MPTELCSRYGTTMLTLHYKLARHLSLLLFIWAAFLSPNHLLSQGSRGNVDEVRDHECKLVRDVTTIGTNRLS